MCGITGIYNVNNKTVQSDTIHQMCETFRYRGPDDEGIYVNNSIGLGIRRLAVIDLNTGHQPIHNEDKNIWVVLNGEIYNFQEIRKTLESKHRFYTKTDTEVIVHLYEEYGEKCVEYLRGMYAFAVWDEKERKLFIAKDRLGKKPLYYTHGNGTFVFSSEIKAILKYLGKTPEIDNDSINLFLTYQYIPSPRTIFKNIYSLLPAHTLTFGSNSQIKIEKYWDLDFSKKTELSFSDSCYKVKELLSESTKIRMVADVPLGAFLSGGQDSSIIVGLMSQLSEKPIKTFSIGFDEKEYSELKYAKRVAEYFKTEHHEYIVKPNFIELLPDIVWHYGQPFADPSALPSFVVSRETRKHLTVALNGDGGDEAFGGYLRYKAMKASIYSSLPFKLLGKKLTSGLAGILLNNSAGEKSNSRYLARMISALYEAPAMRNIAWHSFFSEDDKKKLYSDKFKEVLAYNAYGYMKNIFDTAPANTIMDRTFYTDLKTYLPECLLVKMDIASMSNSLEARSPFLDHKLMEFSASLPDNYKVKALNSKYILKNTFKDFLPKEIIDRRKMGFGIPLGKWFRKGWKDYYKEIVLSEKALSRNYFNKDELEKLFKEHICGKKDNGYKMWSLLMLELWHKKYID